MLSCHSDDFDEDLNSIELVQRGHHVLRCVKLLFDGSKCLQLLCCGSCIFVAVMIRAQNINVFNNLFGLPTAEDKPSGGKTHPVRRRSDGELDEVGGVAMSTLVRVPFCKLTDRMACSQCSHMRT